MTASLARKMVDMFFEVASSAANVGYPIYSDDNVVCSLFKEKGGIVLGGVVLGGAKTSMITKDPVFDDSEALLDFLFTLRPPDLSTTPVNEGALKLLQELYRTFLARATVEEDNALEDRALAQQNGSTEDNDFECCTEVLRALGNIENARPRYRCRGKKPCSYLGFNTAYAKSDLHKQRPSMRLLVEPHRDVGA
jgi:hypothetical protein